MKLEVGTTNARAGAQSAAAAVIAAVTFMTIYGGGGTVTTAQFSVGVGVDGRTTRVKSSWRDT